MSAVAHRGPVTNDSNPGTPLRRQPVGRRRWRVSSLALAAIAGAVAFTYGLYEFTGVMVSQPTPRVVFVTGGSGPQWQLAAEGAREAARGAIVDLQVIMPMNEGDADEQSAILAHLDPPAIGGVAICPLNAEGQTGQLQELGRATRLVTYGADAPLSRRLCYFGLRNYAAARQCAQAIAAALPEGGEVLVLADDLENPRVADHIDGLQHELTHAPLGDGADVQRCVLVASLADGGDSARCTENVRRALVEHPQLACIVDLAPRSSATMVRALTEANRLGDVKLFALDRSDETLEAVERGEVYATIVDDPYQCGFQAVRGLLAISRYSSVELPAAGRGLITVRGRIVRQDNVGEFRTLKAQVGAGTWGG